MSFIGSGGRKTRTNEVIAATEGRRKGGVIPKPRVFISGARNLACIDGTARARRRPARTLQESTRYSPYP